MIYTFTNAAMKPGQYVFINVAKPDQTLSVSAERKNVTRNGFTTPLVRTTVNLSTPEHVKMPDCTDSCLPGALFTRSVRVETSGVALSKALLIEDLELVIKFLKSHTEKLFEGVLPTASVDIVIDTANA